MTSQHLSRTLVCIFSLKWIRSNSGGYFVTRYQYSVSTDSYRNSLPSMVPIWRLCGQYSYDKSLSSLIWKNTMWNFSLYLTDFGFYEWEKYKFLTERITWIIIFFFVQMVSRSPWPQGLRRGFVAVRFLELWVRIPQGACMSVPCEFCVLSGKVPCDGQQSMEWQHSYSPRPKISEYKNFLENFSPRFFLSRRHPPHWLSSKGPNYQRGVLLISAGAIEGHFEVKRPREVHQGGLVLARQCPGSPGTCNPEETGLPGLSISSSPILFSGSGPVRLPPVPWTEKNWKFAIFRPTQR